jgi:hypothetical protein
MYCNDMEICNETRKFTIHELINNHHEQTVQSLTIFLVPDTQKHTQQLRT